MTTPARIQRRRTPGWRTDECTNPLGYVFVDRSPKPGFLTKA